MEKILPISELIASLSAIEEKNYSIETLLENLKKLKENYFPGQQLLEICIDSDGDFRVEGNQEFIVKYNKNDGTHNICFDIMKNETPYQALMRCLNSVKFVSGYKEYIVRDLFNVLNQEESVVEMNNGCLIIYLGNQELSALTIMKEDFLKCGELIIDLKQ